MYMCMCIHIGDQEEKGEASSSRAEREVGGGEVGVYRGATMCRQTATPPLIPPIAHFFRPF